MNLITLIKKFFHKNEVTTTSISSFSELITLPTRADLENNPKCLAAIDKYKHHYSKIISSRRTISSKDLNPNTLRENMNMYIELMLNLMDPEENKISFAPPKNVDGAKRIEYQSKMAKLKVYFYSIKNLELETILRLVALKEILTEKVFLSPSKKNALREEINNLAGLLLVFQNQILAISSETESYLKKCTTLNSKEFKISSKEQEKLLYEYLKELQKIIDIFSIQLNDSNRISLNPYTQIALMEQAIETYIYKHKEEAKSFQTELSTICEKSKEAQYSESLLPKIVELELKYKAFSKYGRKLITKEELYDLYNIKFHILTHNFLAKPELDLVSNSNDIELECYQNIVFHKIETIIKGEIPYLSSKFIELIPEVVKILKNGKKEFNPLEILKNRKLLSFLLAFDNTKGLEKRLDEFFASWETTKESYPNVNFHENYLSWQENFPLSTLYTIMYLNSDESNDSYYKIFAYSLSLKQINRNLPEGLVKITFPTSSNIPESDATFFANLKEYLSSKNIVMPSTLEEINGEVYNNIYAEKVIVNEGLKKIGRNVFNNSKIHELIIPGTLETISEDALENSTANIVHINNISALNLSSGSLDALMKILFQAKKTDKVEYQFVPDSIRRKQADYLSGRYSTCIDSDLFAQDTMYIEYKIVPIYDSLIIHEENKELFRIYTRDIDLTVKRSEYISFNKDKVGTLHSLYPSECSKVRRYLLNLINESLERTSSYNNKTLTKKNN